MARESSKILVAYAMLLACAAAAFSVSAAADGAVPADSGHQPLFTPAVPPIFSAASDPEFVECVKSLQGTEDCVPGLLGSLISGKINLAKECCQIIHGMSEHCFSRIFAAPLVGSVFPGLVKSFCASAVPLPSPSSA